MAARLGEGLRPNDAEWQAFAARDRGGRLVYAVATTGIHCRAGCPARMPLRQNLWLFPDAEAAEAAGYRACKRCGGGGRNASDSQG